MTHNGMASIKLMLYASSALRA